LYFCGESLLLEALSIQQARCVFLATLTLNFAVDSTS
jgi:hypothetical protein